MFISQKSGTIIIKLSRLAIIIDPFFLIHHFRITLNAKKCFGFKLVIVYQIIINIVLDYIEMGCVKLVKFLKLFLICFSVKKYSRWRFVFKKHVESIGSKFNFKTVLSNKSVYKSFTFFLLILVTKYYNVFCIANSCIVYFLKSAIFKKVLIKMLCFLHREIATFFLI